MSSALLYYTEKLHVTSKEVVASLDELLRAPCW